MSSPSATEPPAAEPPDGPPLTESSADAPGPPPDGPPAAEAEAAPPPPPRRHRARTIIASVVGVLAVLMLTVTVCCVWAQATVLRSERVAALAGDALAQPDVQAALASYVTDQVTTSVDLEVRLKDLLPDALDRFAPTIASGAEAAVDRALTGVLSNPDVQQVITTIVERAHARAMDLLQGDGLADGIDIVDGKITLNLLPLVGRGIVAVQSLGLLSDVKVPPMTADGDPKQQQAALEAALGRQLPANFAQLVVYQSDSVAEAQDAVQDAQRLLVMAKRGLWLLLLVTVILIAATILIAPRRGRAGLVLALGIAGAMVVLRSAVRRVVRQAPSLAARPGGKAAIEAILGGASESLLRGAGIVLLVALVVAAILLFVRHWNRVDLVLGAAVVLGSITFAVIGANIWGLVIGVIVGVAVPFVARSLPWTTSRAVAAP
jgi:hypothetical protein